MCSIHLDAARSLAAKGIDKDAFMLFIWLEWTCSAVLLSGIAAMWALSIASRLGCGRLTASRMDLSSGLACGVSGQQLRLDLSPAVCSMPLSYVPTATYRFNLDG